MRYYEKWKQWQYYVIIGVISLVALFFLPMIGSEAGLAWKIPTTVVGWIVYITSKLLVATINILIFHCFILQAKINIQNDPRYLEAIAILDQLSPTHTENSRSPGQYFRYTYGKKGVTIFTTSVLSAVGLTQAVLTFDWISMLTYFFTILMGLIFGVLQMNQTESYWTTEFLRYAKKTKELADKKAQEAEAAKAKADAEAKAKEAVAVVEKELPEQIDDTAVSTGGVDLLEPYDIYSSDGNNSGPMVVGSGSECSVSLGDDTAGDTDATRICPSI